MLNLLLDKLKENNQLILNDDNTLCGKFYADSNLLNMLLVDESKPDETSIINFQLFDTTTTTASNTTNSFMQQTGSNSLNDIVFSKPIIDYPILTSDLVDIVDLPSDIIDNNSGGNKCEEMCCLLKSLDRNNNF
jgi:hypothetical protein